MKSVSMRKRPDLVVPIRDRRQRKRILTLKNFAKAMLAAAILLAALIVQSDLRHPANDTYGRLFGKQVSGHTEVTQPKYDIVREAPVPDQTSADPTLVGPAARAQYLGVDTLKPAFSSSTRF